MRTFLVVFAVFLGLAAVATAQQQLVAPSTSVPSTNTSTPTLTLIEPEWAGTIYRLEDNGKLTSLESRKGEYAYKGRLAGLKYPGATGTIRLSGGVAEFVLRLEGQGDPAQKVSLLALDQDTKKGSRAAYWVPIKFGARVADLKEAAMEGNGDGGIQLKFSKYGTSSVKFAPVTPLPPGEYAFQVKGGLAYLFGVDTK